VEHRQEITALIDSACTAGARKASACGLLGLSVRTLQRWTTTARGDGRPGVARGAHNALCAAERAVILQTMNRPEFADLPPSQIVPRLADQGCYLASESTLYRVLRAADQLRHRHAARPKQTARPRALKAIGPNQIYSWDITYLPSQLRGVFFYCYLVLDIFSRKIVGWHVDESERSEQAALLLQEIAQREGLAPGQVVLHSDNGGPMKGVTMLAMLQQLGVMPSFSRPGVSDDNPYSEALFRTVKYVPTYPGCFESVQHARTYMETFTHWYNHTHYHSGINFVTPASRHDGDDRQVLAQRKEVYAQAKARHPERWSGNTRNWERVETVLLNPEKSKTQNATWAVAA
jgi:transposase InsO family protein